MESLKTMTQTLVDHAEARDSRHHARLNSLRAGVLGANDGIVSVAALLLGVIGSGASAHTIVISGLAATVAGAVSMALGEYVSVSAQRDTEEMLIAKERAELRDFPVKEHRALAGILQEYGMSEETADRAALEMEQGDTLAAHLQLKFGIDSKDLTSPWAAAVCSAASFVVGALLPLLTAYFAPEGSAAAMVAAVTIMTLALTGLASATLAGTNRARSVLRLVVGGALGLAVTFGVGALFGTTV